MPLVAAYYRPKTVEEALALLAGPDRIPLGGGTVINADRERSDIEVVDLQALALDSIELSGPGLQIGAMATFDALSQHAGLPDAIREIARAEQPSTLRTLATVGGLIASADPDSMLLAALLVSDAVVTVLSGGAEAISRDRPLADLLVEGVPDGAIVTSVLIDPSGEMARVATGRTPADVPIVSAVARRDSSGVSLALTGVAPTPVLVDPADPTVELSPTADFRGSSQYRLELAQVLATRVIGAMA